VNSREFWLQVKYSRWIGKMLRGAKDWGVDGECDIDELGGGGDRLVEEQKQKLSLSTRGCDSES